MPDNVHCVRISVNRFCALGDVVRKPATYHPVHMAKQPQSRHYIREWRKFRELTLEKLAERIGMTHQNLGKIERGKVPYNQVLLELLANELRCEPADLIIRDPNLPNGIWSIWDQLEPADQARIVQIAETFRKAG
jgi:transcriptional regulator with XRE-family HTH domain